MATKTETGLRAVGIGLVGVGSATVTQDLTAGAVIIGLGLVVYVVAHFIPEN